VKQLVHIGAKEPNASLSKSVHIQIFVQLQDYRVPKVISSSSLSIDNSVSLKDSLTPEGFEMDLAISAVTSDLAGRFISYLVSKCSDHLCSQAKVERLQQLLLRVHTVVEEADGRHITNSCMHIQLKTLVGAMYKGYHVLDNIRFREDKQLVSDPFALSSSAVHTTPLKRPRTGASSSVNKAFDPDLRTALQNLEDAVANMAEFAVLLGGCERIAPRPYDAYLGVDSFMFGRHVEKQQIIGFLLRHDDVPSGHPAVLPVTGGRGVGKKTLVAHVCGDDRVRSRFATILHLKGGLSRITDHERLPAGRTLVVVEFLSDVQDGDEWTEFYSSVRSMGRGCKVIIFGRDENLKKLGTTKPISVNPLPLEEYRYLFRTLALGSANPAEHPRLAAIVEELARHSAGRITHLGELDCACNEKEARCRFLAL
jgi:hypothetical protein